MPTNPASDRDRGSLIHTPKEIHKPRHGGRGRVRTTGQGSGVRNYDKVEKKREKFNVVAPWTRRDRF